MANDDWNVSVPIDHTLIGDVPGAIRDVTSSTKIILSKEHVQPSTSQAGGQHLQGSAKAFCTSVAPALDPEGNSLATSDTTDNGRIVVLTGASNVVRVYVATSAGVSTGWQTVACKKVYLEENLNANGNAIVSLPPATLSASPVALGQISTTYFGIADPSTTAVVQLNLVSTSLAASGQDGVTVLLARDSTLWSSHSIGGLFSGWRNNDSVANPLAKGAVYLAPQDLFVCAYVGAEVSDWLLLAYTDENSPPTVVVSAAEGKILQQAGNVFFAVKGGEYFKVTLSSGSLSGYKWMGIGGAASPVKQ